MASSSTRAKPKIDDVGGRDHKAFQALREAIRDCKDNPIDLREVVIKFLQRMGGSGAFAQFLHDELLQSKPGGMVRARILDLILQTMKFSIGKEQAEDMQNLTDDDLERKHQELVLKMYPRAHQGVEDGRISADPAAGPEPAPARDRDPA